MNERISICLKQRGLKLKDLAHEAGIPLSTLSDIANSKTKKLDIQKAKDISRILGCTLDFLVDGDLVTEDIGSALKDKRESMGYSLDELSNETKIPIKYLSAFEESEPINFFLLETICKVYGISVYKFYDDAGRYDEFIPKEFDGDVDKYEAYKRALEKDWMNDTLPYIPDIPNAIPLGGTPVPILGNIAAGLPISAQQDIQGYAIPADSVKADFALRVKGDSMRNVPILDGDIVFIRQQPAVENGEIAAVQIDGEATLKRFYKRGDSISLVAENPDYAPMVYTAENCEEFRILGKAVAYQHSFEVEIVDGDSEKT